MAVVVTISSGADAGYPGRSMAGDGQAVAGTSAGPQYYLSATEKGGEPAGKWAGEGLADLGIHDGDRIGKSADGKNPELRQFEKIYGQFTDIRDPSGNSTLGRPPRESSQTLKIYQRKLDAEPAATAERRQQLLMEARESSPTATVRFWDTTFSPDKTIILAHAAALVAAQDAHAAGDAQTARLWESRAAGIWEEIEAADRLYIAYQQQESGYVRTGHHGKRVGDQEAGKFERAGPMPVATFAQHTSRNGDPQLHIHTLFLNRVKTASDGQWRAVDSRALHRNKQAGAAIAALALESGLTERYGFRWAYREASKGRVIAGFDEKLIDEFSSRREQVTRNMARLRDAYRAEHGHDPDQRALNSMRKQAYYDGRASKDDTRDGAARLRDWERQSRSAELGSLRDLAARLWDSAAATADGAPPPAGRQLTPDDERRAMAAGLAQAQQEQSVWGRPELLRSIAQHLPDHAHATSPEQAAQLLEDLAARALRGEAGEQVRRLDAPEWPRVPDSLRRADGESVYTPHGAARYATAAHMEMEQRITAAAQEKTANRVSPELAARLLGMDERAAEAQLRAAQDAQTAQDPDARTATGLRTDQGTAGYLALTSDRRAELIVAGAGTGKTHLAAALARAWEQAGRGTVLGLNMTSAGRNVHTEAGIQNALNTAQYLGDLPGQPGARGAKSLGAQALVLIDEATQQSMPNLDAILKNAGAEDAKIVIIGDPAQLPSVESGGGFDMLTRKLGFAQLQQAERFAHEWEREASLKLREGDKSALADYDQHARLHGGSFDQMAEQSVLDYLTGHLSGESVIITTHTHAERDELNRRTQQHLASWGKTDTSQTVSIADGRTANLGDLLLATRNDNAREAGEQGRTLANSDLMRVTGISGSQVTVQRQTGTGKETGTRTWSPAYTVPASYLAEHGALGYAQTAHASQGSTVTRGIEFGSETASRSGLYPALTRGRESNDAYAYDSASFAGKRWEQGQGERPAPELNRHDKLEAYRAGQPDGDREEHDPVALLARSMDHGQPLLSATGYRDFALGNADHLGLLGHIHHDLSREESAARFTAAVRQSLGDERANEVLADTDDLWRALRHAELAGKDGPQVLAEAAAQRGTDDAQSVSAVLAHRVRENTENLPATPPATWAEQVRLSGEEDKDLYRLKVAAAMDERQQRLGAHLAENPPVWAHQALGDVPEDPDHRAGWENRAGIIGAYREMWGQDHPGIPIGPQPSTTSPEARAAWQQAENAQLKTDGIDVRNLSDGQLLARRAGYERETSWAPKYVADELRHARGAEHDARIDRMRHEEESSAAARDGDLEAAELHSKAAMSSAALGQLAAELREKLEPAQETRQEWEKFTEDTRRLAVASDTELHRRGTLPPGDKLVNAEPEGFTYPPQPQRADGKQHTRAEMEDHQRQALGLTPGSEGLSGQADEIAAWNAEKQRELDMLASLPEPASDPDDIDLGSPWEKYTGRCRDAILQPPKPDIGPAQAVLEAELNREF